MYSLIEQNGRATNGVKQYACDTESDLQSIARYCTLGDAAIVVETGKVYMMNSEGKWVEI